MKPANVETVWDCPSRPALRIPSSEMIWSAAIAWLAGFFLMASAAFVVAGCTGDVTRLPYPEDSGAPSIIHLGNDPIESDAGHSLPRCRSFDYPSMCDPFYNDKHDWGDPQPFNRGHR